MTTAVQRIAASRTTPPPDAPLRWCSKCPPDTRPSGPTVYLDYDLGRDAHEVVFGHQPTQEVS